MKLKCIVLLFLMYFKSDITFASKHISADYFTTKKLEIKELIERGLFNNAHLKCESLLKQHLSNDQRYEILTTQSKLYFWEENMFAFKTAAQEAIKIKSNQPIYQAYYYAQIAFYYHYSFINDSAIINSDKAISLLRKNYSQRYKIPTHFIYQMYATSFVYRTIRDANNKIEPTACPQRLHYYTTYFDSAIYIVRQLNHFPQEEAIIYRSKGSRAFDFIGYHVRTKPSDFKNPIYEWEILNKVILAYQAANSCLPKRENNLRKNLDAMLAMTYYVCMKEDKADSITLPYIEKFYKNPVGEMVPNIINSMSLLSYYIKNAIAKEYPTQKLLKVKSILERILPVWRLYMHQQNIHFFDAYDISPNYQLLQIQEYFLRTKASLANKNDILNLTLDRFSYYSKSSYQKQNAPEIKKKFKNLTAKTELDPSNILYVNALMDLAEDWKNIDFGNKIQKRLNKEEALLVNISNGGSAPFVILVRKKHIDVIKLNSFCPFFENEEISQLPKLKSKGYNIYQHSKVLPEIIKHKIKKLYVTPDFNLPFDWIVTDLKGNQFDELSYFKKKVNVVKIHNPIDFFNGNIDGSLIKNDFRYVWLNPSSVGQLPFSGEFIKKEKGLPIFLRTSDFTQKGILQIIGHGGLETNSNGNFENSTLESKELDKIRTPDFKVNKDLVIFNVCYAGIRRGINIFDLGINNLLLSHGAKAVISSPYQTIDQSSAYIFKKFYSYFFKGQTVEDALQLAKLDYLKEHSGVEAHPIYWSTYELTSNVKDLRLAPEPKSDKSWQAYLLLFVVTAMVLRFYLFWVE